MGHARQEELVGSASGSAGARAEGGAGGLSGGLLPHHQQAVESAAQQGLAELAGREVRAELSAWEGRPVLWAARLSPCGHDLLIYADVSPAPAPQHKPADGDTLVELRPAEMDALRVYVSTGALVRVQSAEGLAQRARAAGFDRPANRWTLCLTEEQLESVVYALYVRSMSGSTTEANRFCRTYGLFVQADPANGGLPRAKRPTAFARR